MQTSPELLHVKECARELRITPAGVRRAIHEGQLYATVATLERELGLTPAAMLRMRLVVEEPEPVEEPQESPYAHLRAREGRS